MSSRPEGRLTPRRSEGDPDPLDGPSAELTTDPPDQSPAGRGVGRAFATILGVLMIALPVTWAVYYLTQNNVSALGVWAVVLGLIILVPVLVCVGLLLRYLLTLGRRAA